MTKTLAVAAGTLMTTAVALAQPRVDADNVQEFQGGHPSANANRAEQKFTEHDRAHPKPMASSAAFADQPDQGTAQGFDPYKDAFNTKKPNETFDALRKADEAAKKAIMDRQRQLLESRYDLTPHTDPGLRMTRGKLIAIGPTARLRAGMDFDKLAAMTPAQIKQGKLFPYPALPHPKHATGGMVFPPVQLEQFPRLTRFDVDFDLPEAFLPEFPPAMFLQNRPELGDVSRGEVVSINNYYALFKDVLTPVQLDGLRMLVTPFPQEEFNATDDRKSARPSLGVTCLDCHVNGHTTGQFHLNPDDRPQERRMRIDTVSLRGLFNQQVHGSKRSLRSVEDFTEFEQRTAYFNGDQIHAAKKGMNIISRLQVSHMAQMQNMLDFPPAPKLTVLGKLDPAKASDSEKRGEKLFFGKAQCGTCHPAPFYLDNLLHDLHTERFLDEAPPGPMKTFTLRGIRESPPYLHDGRCLTLEDTVEFFNLVLETHLDRQERADLVAFMRAL
jgi:cytochrome c peroxidase